MSLINHPQQIISRLITSFYDSHNYFTYVSFLLVISYVQVVSYKVFINSKHFLKIVINGFLTRILLLLQFSLTSCNMLFMFCILLLILVTIENLLLIYWIVEFGLVFFSVMISIIIIVNAFFQCTMIPSSWNKKLSCSDLFYEKFLSSTFKDWYLYFEYTWTTSIVHTVLMLSMLCEDEVHN